MALSPLPTFFWGFLIQILRHRSRSHQQFLDILLDKHLCKIKNSLEPIAKLSLNRMF